MKRKSNNKLFILKKIVILRIRYDVFLAKVIINEIKNGVLNMLCTCCVVLYSVNILIIHLM